jgi:hypothetical protein
MKDEQIKTDEVKEYITPLPWTGHSRTGNANSIARRFKQMVEDAKTDTIYTLEGIEPGTNAGVTVLQVVGTEQGRINAEYIRHVCNNYPSALDEIEKLRLENRILNHYIDKGLKCLLCPLRWHCGNEEPFNKEINCVDRFRHFYTEHQDKLPEESK